MLISFEEDQCVLCHEHDGDVNALAIHIYSSHIYSNSIRLAGTFAESCCFLRINISFGYIRGIFYPNLTYSSIAYSRLAYHILAQPSPP